MSPAIDATVRLPAAPKGEGEIFKDVAEEENVGGKGLNVARWLAVRGANVACGGLLGEDNAAPFEREMAKYGIEDKFTRVSGSTRRNEMIVWPGGSMKLNRSAFPGLELPPSVATSAILPGAALPGAIAILSGSLPPAVPKDFYAQAVRHLKALGFAVVLDASGAALVEGVKARPDVIKPNAEECEALVGFTPRTPDEFKRATEMLQKTAEHVIISDGASGAWFDGAFTAAPKIDAVDTTAAGDTLLAEFCWRLGCADGRRAAWAVAAGSAACLMPGGAPPAPETVERLYKEIP